MNTLRILEISWLIFGLVGIGLCVYNFATEGIEAVLWPLLFTLVASAFYFVRRKQRISFDKQRQQQTQHAE